MELEEIASLEKGITYEDQTSRLYAAILPKIEDVVVNIDNYSKLWQPEDDRLKRSEDAIASGHIVVEDYPDIDLTVVTVSPSGPALKEVHEVAIHNNTKCFTTALVHAGEKRYHVNYRYESSVDYQTKPLPHRRVDLRPLASSLTRLEENNGNSSTVWVYDDRMSFLTYMRLESRDEGAAFSFSRDRERVSQPSTLTPKEFIGHVTDFLRSNGIAASL